MATAVHETYEVSVEDLNELGRRLIDLGAPSDVHLAITVWFTEISDRALGKKTPRPRSESHDD